MSYTDRIVPADEIERARKLAAKRARVAASDVGRARLAVGETNAGRIAALLKNGEDAETAAIARAIGLRVGHTSTILKHMVARGTAVRVARGVYRCPG